MLGRLFFVCTSASLLLAASRAASPTSGLSCPKADKLILASTSETVWTITCSSATKPLVSFDPLLLRGFDVKNSDEIVLTPDGALQPTEMTLPNATIEIGELKSSVLNKFSLKGSPIDKNLGRVSFTATSFSGLTLLRSLTINYIGLVPPTKAWTISPSVESLDLDSTQIEAFDVAVPTTGAFNLSRISASYAKIKDIPSVVFNAPNLDNVNFHDVKFGPQKLSQRRLERLQQLFQNHTLTIDSIESFKTDCDGKPVTLQNSGSFFVPSKSFLVCVVPTQDGDESVAKDTPPPTDPPTSKKKPTPEPGLSKEDKDAIKDILKGVSSGAESRDLRVMMAATIVAVLSMLSAL